MKFETEYTDTYGGEANYCWAKRAEFEAPEDASNRTLVGRAKKALGVDGRFRCVLDGGDLLRYDERGWTRCLFIASAANQGESE